MEQQPVGPDDAAVELDDQLLLDGSLDLVARGLAQHPADERVGVGQQPGGDAVGQLRGEVGGRAHRALATDRDHVSRRQATGRDVAAAAGAPVDPYAYPCVTSIRRP